MKKVYAELLKYNSRLKKSLTLEKLAQSHSCVRSHSDHRNSWQDKKALKNDSSKRKTLSSIIACVNGCKEGAYTTCGGDRPSSLPKVWTRKNPTFYWEYCKCQNKHYKAILDYTVMGCSATKRSHGEACIFCYLNGKKT